MKRIFLIGLILCLLCAGTDYIFSYTNEASLQINVNIFNEAIISVTNHNGEGNIVDLGGYAVSNAYYHDACGLFRNNGNQPCDFEIKAVPPAGMSLITGDIGSGFGGNDRIRLSAVCVDWQTNIGLDDFQDGTDVITNDYAPCNSTNFARLQDPAHLKGYDVTPNGQINFKFAFECSTVTTEGNKSITVWIKAVPSS